MSGKRTPPKPSRVLAFALAVLVVGLVAWQLIAQWRARREFEKGSTTAAKLVDEGRLSEAERELEGALEGARKLGDRDADLDVALRSLAKVRQAQGKFDDVLHLHLQSYQTRIARFGSISSQAAEAVTELGGIYLIRNENLQAEGAFSQALETWEQLGEDRGIASVPAHIGVGKALERQDKLDKAEASYQQALKIEEAKFGAEDPQLAPTLLLIANVLEKSGQVEQAARYRQRAETIIPSTEPPSTDTPEPTAVDTATPINTEPAIPPACSDKTTPGTTQLPACSEVLPPEPKP